MNVDSYSIILLVKGMKGHDEDGQEHIDHLEEDSGDGQLASGDYLELI